MVEQLPFEQLCKVLEDLFSKKKNKPEQEKILINFFQELKVSAKQQGKTNSNLFPVLRLLLPEIERERGAYNLKEVKLGQLLVKVLSLAKSSRDAEKLHNFRTVRNSDEGSDFPSVAYFVILSRLGQKTGELTVAEINDSLDKIAAAQVGNKGPVLDDLFTRVIKKTSAKQAKWFLRIVLKDLKIGLGKHRILGALHPDAPDYYDQCSSLTKVCNDLDEGNTRPPDQGAELYSAVSPMLSERLDATRASCLTAASYQLEVKLDGERFQMHMQDSVFEYFSRRGIVYSDKYGKTFYSDGLLTPKLKDCFRSDAKSFILDGEMMGWDKRRECFGSKGMSYDIKKVTENSRYQPCFVVFDILYYNGRSLVGPPEKGGVTLKDRMKILDTVFDDVPGVIQHSKRWSLENPSELLSKLNEANENGEEGLVVKDRESYYIANKRNAGWYKTKMEYTEGTMTDLDLVVIGADYAENKRQGLAKSFVVAVVDSTGDGPRRFLAIGRVSTGLKFEEREKICTSLEAHWKPTAKEPPPSHLVFNRAKPELWVLPEYSVVFTVRASELIYSRDFATDYTIRFQRVTKVRDDKPYYDVMTLDEYNALSASKQSVVKLSTNQIKQEDAIAMKSVARRKRTAKSLQVAENFRCTTGEVVATSQALLGRKICVLSDDEDCKKTELETMILSHGGIVVQNIGDDTWCSIAGRQTVRVRNVITTSQCDIISTMWLKTLTPSKSLCPPPKPLDMVFVCDKTRLRLAKDFDQYGDGYREMIDEDSLRRCFEKMERDNEPQIYLTTEEMIEIDEELGTNDHSFLRPCYLHFKDKHSFQAIKANFYGAKLCDINDQKLTHVVACTENAEELRGTNRPIVSLDWLEACFASKQAVPVENFLL